MNLNRIFDGLVSSGVAGGLAGGAASALLVQGLSSKKGRKRLGKAAKLGGAAVIGGLAWKAYEQYRAGQTAAASTVPSEPWQDLSREAFIPVSAAPTARRDLLVLRAMITAAHADGHVDTDERVKIYQRIESLDISHAEKGLLMEEISQPLELHQLVQQVPVRAFAAEVYLAALLVADTPEPAHRIFLHDLAEQLALPPELVLSLHEQVDAAQRDAARREAPAKSEDRSACFIPLPNRNMLSPQA